MDNKEAQELLKKQGFKFKKQMGQNFIFNTFILDQIVDLAGITADDFVIEIGAGAGTLTEAIAKCAKKVVTIELDRSLIDLLNKRFMDKENIELIQGDALKADLDKIANDRGYSKYKIVSNLPYQISTPFLTNMLKNLKNLDTATIMVQKEVALKVVAKPNEDGYGMLSLLSKAFGHSEIIMDLEPGYFTPAPPVDSSILFFKKEEKDLGVDEKSLWLIIRGVLNQRRKTILNGLKALGAFEPKNNLDWPSVLEKAGISKDLRGETLDLSDFVKIAKAAGYEK